MASRRASYVSALVALLTFAGSGCGGSNAVPHASGAAPSALTARPAGGRVRIRQFSDLPNYPRLYTPVALTTGPDGALWVADDIDQDAGQNAIARIAKSGKRTATFYYQADASPAFVDIAAGPDGALWLSDSGDVQIVRLTTDGTFTVFPLTVDPMGIVAGPDGALWFVADGFLTAAVCRITTDGVVTQYSSGLSTAAALQDIAVGPDGAFWFTELNDRIGRITTRGKIKEFAAGITSGSQPYSIVAGPDGALWFTEMAGGRIGRITTAGHVTEYATGITPGEQPVDLVAGGDGAIWFTEYKGPYQHEHDSRIGRITTSGAVTEYRDGLDPKSGPTGITLGPDGKVWFVETVTNKLGRVAY